MEKVLWLMCGVPGSGKSYFVKHTLMPAENAFGWAYISRDEIRYSLVSEREPYFSKEDEVFNTFIKRINEALERSCFDNIVVDATHLNTASRMKVLNRLNLDGVKVVAMDMNTPLEVCIERNNTRSGRECVPESVIRKMYKSRTNPLSDPFKYEEVLEVFGE